MSRDDLLPALPSDWIRLFMAYCVSSAGDRITVVALFALFYARGGDVQTLTLLAFCQVTPAIIFGQLGGRLGAKGNQRWHLVALDIFRALLLIACTVVQQQSIFYVIVTLHAAAGAVYRPVDAILETQIVEEADLPRVNSYRVIARQIISIAGPGAAGLLLIIATPSALLAIDAATYIVSAIITGSISAGGKADPSPQPVTDPRRASALLRKRGHLFMVFGSVIALNLAMGMQGPLFFDHLSHLFVSNGETMFGLMLSAMALGSILMGIVLAKRSAIANWREVLAATILVDGVALLAFTFIDELWLLLCLSMLMGAIASVYVIIVRTTLQTWPEKSSRSMLLGMYESLSGGAQVASLAIASLVVVWLSAAEVLRAAAAAEIILALICLALIVVYPRATS
jgi:DHA3 family macrolide efflux protein-like MFS transporter